MRRVLTLALAGASTIGFASAANATVTVTVNSLNGNLSQHITEDTPVANQNNFTVFGSDNGGTSADVAFTGNVKLNVTNGGGFASINAFDSTQTFSSLIIDPLHDFTDYEFAVATDNASTITVYYQLAGQSAWYITSAI